ncbi:MAG TPA: response regulator, partial [Roseiflexaceae bacterium]|nr:response regulator [Roseiflexaceae bacterium]
EVPVLRYMTRLLEKLGYQTTGFTDPAVGLQFFQEQPYGFDAVVTDYSMPGMSGLDLISRLSATRPEVPILLVSGYIQPRDFEEAGRREFYEVLAKPYSSALLARALQRILPKEREV